MTRWRPTTPAPGHRPAAGVRFAAGVCPCGTPFVLDRAAQPWARARTCSTACARRAGHRARRPDNRHRDLVLGYRLARDADVQRIEVSGRDEDARAVTFREWLEGGGWNRDGWSDPLVA